jgi:hypothetical protein
MFNLLPLYFLGIKYFHLKNIPQLLKRMSKKQMKSIKENKKKNHAFSL